MSALTLTRISLFAMLLNIGGLAHAQAADVKPLPDFDVSTIKPNNTGSESIDIRINNDSLRATNVQVKMLLEFAYNAKQDEIFNLPHWAEVSHYDIIAKIVDADPKVLDNITREQRAAMVRHLIDDRFQIKTHTETRMLPVLNLVVGKTGSKLTPSPAQSNDGKDLGSMQTNNTDFTARHVSVADFCSFLADQTHNPVVDKTRLNGRFDFELKWQRDEQQSGLTDTALPTLYTALQEQLGLKLESAKGPVDVLVVDQIAEPTEN